MLDPVEEALDPVAQLVGSRTECWRIDAVADGTDIRIRTLIGDQGPQRIGIVATVGEQQAVFSKPAQHIVSARAVVSLAFRQLDVDREPVRIDESVDFGREPAAGTAHATASAAFFSPFAACWCTRTTDESIIWILPL